MVECDRYGRGGGGGGGYAAAADPKVMDFVVFLSETY